MLQEDSTSRLATSGSLDGRVPVQSAQVSRIINEGTTLAKRASVKVPRLPRTIGTAEGILELIKWTFSVRKQLCGMTRHFDWPNSFSRFGPAPKTRVLLTSEYQRSELTIDEDSPLAHFYPWLSTSRCGSLIRYTANGMAAVAAFLLGLARWARQNRTNVSLITTPLYHETAQLLRSWHFEELVNWRMCESASELLCAFEEENRPCALFLDSSELVDTTKLIQQLFSQRHATNLLGIAWDNTCLPFDMCAPPRSFTAPLYLIRSHLKLDQLGFELGALGSITVVTGEANFPLASRFLQEFLPVLPKHCQLLGVNASADLLRRLHVLVLPDPKLTPASNAALVTANRLGAHILTKAMKNHDGIRVITYPHNCFCSIVLRRPNGGPPSTPQIAAKLARKIHFCAKRQCMPILNAASFGFPFTAVNGFQSAWSNQGLPSLRIAFGGHDPVVTEAVALTIIETLKTTA